MLQLVISRMSMLSHLAATGESPQKASWKQLYEVNVEVRFMLADASNLNIT